MKNLFILFAVLILFNSCKKDQELNGRNVGLADETKYDVTFNLKGFKQSHGGIVMAAPDSATGNIPGNVVYINFLLYSYDSTNFVTPYVLIDSVRQLRYDEGFGTYKARVGKGHYKVAAVASRTEVWPYYIQDSRSWGLWYSENTSDLFLGTADLNVVDSSVNQELALKRIVGQIELVFEDAIPKNLARIDVEMSAESHVYVYFTPSYDSPYHIFDDVKIPTYIQEDDWGKRNYKIVFYALNASMWDDRQYAFDKTPLNLRLRTYMTGSDTPRNTIVIPNIDNQPNQKTILTGRLFDEPSAFTAKIDSNFYTVSYDYF